MSTLTDDERATLLAPCACGHSSNDHGDLAGCWWEDPDDADVPMCDCAVPFTDLLAERVAAIVDARVARRTA